MPSSRTARYAWSGTMAQGLSSTTESRTTTTRCLRHHVARRTRRRRAVRPRGARLLRQPAPSHPPLGPGHTSHGHARHRALRADGRSPGAAGAELFASRMQSGTTQAAELARTRMVALGRQWIGVDLSPGAATLFESRPHRQFGSSARSIRRNPVDIRSFRRQPRHLQLSFCDAGSQKPVVTRGQLGPSTPAWGGCRSPGSEGPNASLPIR